MTSSQLQALLLVAAVALFAPGASGSSAGQPLPGLLPGGVQQLPFSRAVSYLRVGGGWQPQWFLCDGLETPAITVGGLPDASGWSRFATYSKTRFGAPRSRTYRVGRPEPGAGSIYWSLTPGASRRSDAPGSVGSFNTGMLDHPETALTPAILTLNTAPLSGDCRWVVNTRLLGFSGRRSFMVTQTPEGQTPGGQTRGGALTYQTFDFAEAASSRRVMPDGVQRSSVPTLSVGGGVRTLTAEGERFTFRNRGYSYTVRVARLGRTPGASVTVSRRGRILQTEELTAYTYAVRTPSSPFSGGHITGLLRTK